MELTNFDEIQSQNFIQLEGISGLFKTPNSKFRVRFFSTYANNYESNYSRLLEELKPMRERISIDQIRNITQVLQRDLDDFRISEGLIPYLLNKINGITDNKHLAFFPAILGVIIPKNYLTQNLDNSNTLQSIIIKYPEAKVEESEKSRIVNYKQLGSDFVSWKIKQNKSGHRISPISLLELDTKLSEIIVLDGQHRANAFRVACDTFFSNPDNRIYEPFYDRGAVFEPGFDTNLPVTLICFESSDPATEIIPDLISRKLFIDVNNNAKPISSSRKILLDDRDPSSILTNCFYSILAERNGFDTVSGNLSLIHLGFDTNHSIKQRRKDNILNITNPELISIIFDWYFFGTRRYNDLSFYLVQRMESLRFSLPIFTELMPDSRNSFCQTKNEEGNDIKVINGASELPRVFQEFKAIHFEPISIIFNKIHFLRDHYAAVSEMTRRRNTVWTSSKRDVWDEIFIGGEGLYFSYEKLISSSDQLTSVLNDKKNTIEEIEKEFRELRASFLNVSEIECNSLFDSFSTLAFQVALFMAYYDFTQYYVRLRNESFDNPVFQVESANHFVNRINSVNKDIWVKVFTVVRPQLWAGVTDPKKWPSYHKLILRLIQDPQDQEFYNNQFYNESPEAQIFSLKFKGKIEAFLKQEFTDFELANNPISASDFKNQFSSEKSDWENECFSEVQNLFEDQLGIQLLSLDCDRITDSVINKMLN